MVRLCCLTAAASGGVSDVTKGLIEVGLDIKHEHKVRVWRVREGWEILTHFGTVTKYALARVWSMDGKSLLFVDARHIKMVKELIKDGLDLR